MKGSFYQIQIIFEIFGILLLKWIKKTDLSTFIIRRAPIRNNFFIRHKRITWTMELFVCFFFMQCFDQHILQPSSGLILTSTRKFVFFLSLSFKAKNKNNTLFFFLPKKETRISTFSYRVAYQIWRMLANVLVYTLHKQQKERIQLLK